MGFLNNKRFIEVYRIHQNGIKQPDHIFEYI